MNLLSRLLAALLPFCWAVQFMKRLPSKLTFYYFGAPMRFTFSLVFLTLILIGPLAHADDLNNASDGGYEHWHSAQSVSPAPVPDASTGRAARSSATSARSALPATKRPERPPEPRFTQSRK